MKKEILLQALKHISEIYFNKKDFVSAGQINLAMDVVEDFDGTLPGVDIESWKNIKNELPEIGTDKQYPFASEMLLLSDGEFTYYGQYESSCFVDANGDDFADDGVEIIYWTSVPEFNKI